MESSVHVTVRVPPDLNKKLKTAMKLTGKKRSRFIIEAIKAYLSQLEAELTSTISKQPHS